MVTDIHRVITFYSFKGGVGRSMALANIGACLASWGYKVLLIDWDLEAPGLENYFSNFLDVQNVKQKKGVIDLLNFQEQDSADIDVNKLDWNEYVTEIFINNQSVVSLITAGRRDENYTNHVRELDYDHFYENSNGGEYLENLREYWLSQYNFILIDSRTGLTDSSGICCIHMPDILVLLFTPNDQSFNGIREVAQRAIAGQSDLIYDRFRLRTLPIPARIEAGETSLLDEWMDKINIGSKELFDWLPTSIQRDYVNPISPEEIIKHIRIPYKTLYAYGERLAVMERDTNSSLEIGFVYETIAAILAKDLQEIGLLTDSRDQLLKSAKTGNKVEIQLPVLNRNIIDVDILKRDLGKITSSADNIEKKTAEVLDLFNTVLQQPGLIKDSWQYFVNATRSSAAYNASVTILESLPKPLWDSVEYLRNYGSALSRVGRQHEAIVVLNKALEMDDASSETLSILGRIYKDKFVEFEEKSPVKAAGYRDKAIETYLAGFKADMQNSYLGVYAVNLLIAKKDPSASDLAKVVEFSLNVYLEKNSSPSQTSEIANYWPYATLLVLAVIQDDPKKAYLYLSRILSLQSEKWQRETTIADLRIYASKGEWVNNIIKELSMN